MTGVYRYRMPLENGALVWVWCDRRGRSKVRLISAIGMWHVCAREQETASTWPSPSCAPPAPERCSRASIIPQPRRSSPSPCRSHHPWRYANAHHHAHAPPHTALACSLARTTHTAHAHEPLHHCRLMPTCRPSRRAKATESRRSGLTRRRSCRPTCWPSWWAASTWSKTPLTLSRQTVDPSLHASLLFRLKFPAHARTVVAVMPRFGCWLRLAKEPKGATLWAWPRARLSTFGPSQKALPVRLWADMGRLLCLQVLQPLLRHCVPIAQARPGLNSQPGLRRHGYLTQLGRHSRD